MEITLDDIINGTPAYNKLNSLVPLGNSEFQLRNFGINHLGVARTLRQAIMQLREESDRLHKAKIDRRRSEIKIEQKKKDIEKLKAVKGEVDNYTVEMIELDIEELEYAARDQQILIEDALLRVQVSIDILKNLPADMSHEKFEEDELQYWRDRLTMEARLQILQHGTINAATADSLVRIGMDPVHTFVVLQAEVEAKKLNAQKEIVALVEENQKAISSPPPK